MVELLLQRIANFSIYILLQSPKRYILLQGTFLASFEQWFWGLLLFKGLPFALHLFLLFVFPFEIAAQIANILMIQRNLLLQILACLFQINALIVRIVNIFYLWFCLILFSFALFSRFNASFCPILLTSLVQQSFGRVLILSSCVAHTPLSFKSLVKLACRFIAADRWQLFLIFWITYFGYIKSFFVEFWGVSLAHFDQRLIQKVLVGRFCPLTPLFSPHQRILSFEVAQLARLVH